MELYGLQGKFKAKEGFGQELATILVEASRLMSNAPGCHVYIVGQQADDPDTVMVTEVWDSKEYHDQSLKIDGVSGLIQKAMPLLASPPQKGTESVIVGGHGL